LPVLHVAFGVVGVFVFCNVGEDEPLFYGGPAATGDVALDCSFIKLCGVV
jgi:hypothetical protein